MPLCVCVCYWVFWGWGCGVPWHFSLGPPESPGARPSKRGDWLGASGVLNIEGLLVGFRGCIGFWGIDGASAADVRDGVVLAGPKSSS